MGWPGVSAWLDKGNGLGRCVAQHGQSTGGFNAVSDDHLERNRDRVGDPLVGSRLEASGDSRMYKHTAVHRGKNAGT
jgi:hypothetical protein